MSNKKSGGLLELFLSVLGGILTFFKLYAGGQYLPPGMSFYLFQIAAYLIALYNSRVEAETDLLNYTAQIVMFPKLLSGPLMEPRDLQSQSRTANLCRSGIHEGCQLLILGLGLKVLLANRLGGFWSSAEIFGYAYISVPMAWLALMSFAMQLYFDFYGYSLMARGLGKMLGYIIPRNFDTPYAAKTVSEFYRRWHMTLGAWFRENLYIPLGGNRKGNLRTILNLAVVWLFTGLWHGIGGNYLLWAGVLLVLIVNERLWLGKYLNRSRVLCHIYVVFVILLSWLPFAVGDWTDMITLGSKLLGLTGTVINPRDFIIFGRGYELLWTAGLILATPLPQKIWQKISHTVWADILLSVLFWIVVYFLATSAQDPFLYFQY